MVELTGILNVVALTISPNKRKTLTIKFILIQVFQYKRNLQDFSSLLVTFWAILPQFNRVCSVHVHKRIRQWIQLYCWKCRLVVTVSLLIFLQATSGRQILLYAAVFSIIGVQVNCRVSVFHTEIIVLLKLFLVIIITWCTCLPYKRPFVSLQ